MIYPTSRESVLVSDDQRNDLSKGPHQHLVPVLTNVTNLSPFQMINAVTDVQEDTVVEVVVSAQQLSDDDVEIRPHQLSIHSYKTPTFCHFCGEMLFGMFKQVQYF